MSEKSSFPPGFLSPEHFFSAIIDSSDDAIVSKDLNGIVTSWNKGAERIFGYTAEEVVGQPILLLIPKERQHEEPMFLKRLRAGERIDHFETQRVRKDGTIVEISLTISPIRNAEGVIVGASKIARDITIQKRAAAVMAASSQEMEHQSRMKDEFLATLSHELRTPLQSIIGWVQILQGGSLDETELQEGLTVIGRNAQSQQRIIEEMLDMNRIMSGKVRLDIQRVELPSVIHAALETLRPAAEAKKIRVRAILDPLAKPVSGDPQRLQQVFWNILSNAVKFTPRDGSIEVLLQRVNSHLEVSVSDSGVGISDEFLPHVFDRFRQEDASNTRTHGGLGLGLAIVKHLVELHGGRVIAKSLGVGKGATFAVHLPLTAVHEKDHGAIRHTTSNDPQLTMPALPPLDNLSLIVVDDDEDSRNLINRTLTKAGAIVRTAGSADEGMKLIDEALPDVLMSDIGMPEKNGYSFVEELRLRSEDKGGKIPAVALTAYTRVEDKIQALCSGFQILLPKPVDAQELLATVASLAKRAK